jgi:hypothetical protein
MRDSSISSNRVLLHLIIFKLVKGKSKLFVANAVTYNYELKTIFIIYFIHMNFLAN